MVTVSEAQALLAPKGATSKGQMIIRVITSTDHKVIGNLYLGTAMVFFAIGGLLALVIRLELFTPGLQAVQNKMQYNQLFTMHGLIMLLLFATAVFTAWGNILMPLQIGAPDVAFPRLNMLSYRLYVFGGLIAATSLVMPGGPPGFGWYLYAPLTNTTYSPGIGNDLGIFGLALTGFGTILGAVNFITTIICMRAPGMTMFRMPIFTWNTLITSVLVIMIFPLLATALFALGADRKLGATIFEPENGGPILWQHLFWFFGHPEVYVLALPFFGIVSETIPVFSRKPLFGYKGLIFATIGLCALPLAVWAHHMYTTGQVNLPFFALMTSLIAVPTGVKFFNWIGTMWNGSITFETPMLWALGFLATFLFGGVTGVMLATPTMDFQMSDTYFVVAHFHYTLIGMLMFVVYAGIYFWFPKMSGKMLNERIGKWHFWVTFLGFHTTFLVQHWIGFRNSPRRYADYLPEDGITTFQRISTVGSLVLGPVVPVPRLQRHPHPGQGAEGRGRRPLGLRGLARVGDVLPAAATQLQLVAADPVRAARVRPAPS